VQNRYNFSDRSSEDVLAECEKGGLAFLPWHPLCPLNVKTAPSWRGIVPFTHLAREGRMTVTIGRRELLVALGGAA
jgi:hypothetical protein